jgi:hypothetical protein
MTPLDYFYKLGSEQAMMELLELYPPQVRPLVAESIKGLNLTPPEHMTDYTKWVMKNLVKGRGDLRRRILRYGTKSISKDAVGEAKNELGLLAHPGS